MVVSAKPKSSDEIQLCVDLRLANRAVKRERHPMPSIDDILFTVNESSVFCKLDLCPGNHQVELHPQSCCSTTFATQPETSRGKMTPMTWLGMWV